MRISAMSTMRTVTYGQYEPFLDRIDHVVPKSSGCDLVGIFTQRKSGIGFGKFRQICWLA
jgi:hypothetical protein